MSETKYIQHENVLLIITCSLLLIAMIWWTYSSDKKRDIELKNKNESISRYIKSFSWRLYIIAGTGLMIMLFELVKRIINFSF